MCRLSRSFGNIILLEPKGPVQCSIGMAIPLKCTELHSELRSSSVQLYCEDFFVLVFFKSEGVFGNIEKTL